MASASSKVGGLAVAIRVIVPVALGSAGYAAYKVNWPVAIHNFLTGPGRTSRIALLLFVVFNWKNLPFAWTVSWPLSPYVESKLIVTSSIESSTPSSTTTFSASLPPSLPRPCSSQ